MAFGTSVSSLKRGLEQGEVAPVPSLSCTQLPLLIYLSFGDVAMGYGAA